MEISQSSLRAEPYWQILKRRWIPALAVFFAISIWGIVSTAIKADIYEAEGKLKFNKSSVSSSIKAISRELEVLDSWTNQSEIVNTEAEVIQSTPIVKKTINDLKLTDKRGNPLKVQDFLHKLNVSIIATTDILRVSYQDSDPERAEKVINTLISNYLENNITAHKNEALEVKKLLEAQIPKTQQALLNTEALIKEIRIKNQILSPQEEASKLVTNLGDLENRLTEARSEITRLSSQSQYIKEQLNMNAQQALNATNISQSPAIQQIVTQLQELEWQLNQEQSRFTDNNPQIVDLREKIKLKKQLLAAQIKKVTGFEQQFSPNAQFGVIQEELTVELIKLESISIGLTQQIAYLSKIEQDLKQKVTNLPEVEQQLTQLERELETSQRTYELLQNQLSLVEVAANQNFGNVRVISSAVAPDTPVSSRAVGYISALSLGLISAVGVVYLLEARDPSLRTIEEAKQLFGYNWLAIIPTFEKSQLANLAKSSGWLIPPLIVRDDPSSSVSESYRMLQSNLRFLDSDRPIQTIVVTSSISGEGKSTVAANLGGAMAQVGHKVLLVDADLHAPIQHKIWGTYSQHGLSDLLADNLDYRLATETVMKNLSIVSSGATPPSPGNLLDSYRMKDLMHYWSRVYDFVIIDSPSLDRAADAPILGRMADGILLVVKPEAINRSQADFAKETLKRSGQNVLGIVFNNINPKVDAGVHYYHVIENEPKTLPQAQLSGASGEDLWDIILRASQESPQLQLSSPTNSQQLLDTPVDQLQETLNGLQQDLEQLTALVEEEEEELFMQRQTVRKLQRQVNLATLPESLSLEQKLDQEQEIKQMLEKSLIGQRHNLARKRNIIRQYQEILHVKQT